MEKGIYVGFEVWEGPKSPEEYGKYIGKTPILKQALDAVENYGKSGVICFIKGIRNDGTRVCLI